MYAIRSYYGQSLPAGQNVFLYVYRGEISVAGTVVPSQRMAILTNDPETDGVAIQVDSDARVLLIAGQPLGEPIVQYGPFVMNSEQEVYQALADYREGRLA